MGIISFSGVFSRMPVLSILLAPLQSLTALFVPANQVSGDGAARSDSKLAYRAVAVPVTAFAEPKSYSMMTTPEPRQTAAKGRHTVQRPKPAITRLKILREFDPGIGRACAGRMIISGRMADVCAELDRMEQRERATCHH